MNAENAGKISKNDRIWYAMVAAVLLAVVTGAAVFLILYIDGYPMEITNREDALKMFRKHETVFRAAAETGDFSPVEKLRGVQSTETRGNGQMIYLGGSGLGPSTHYFHILWLKDGLNTGPDSGWEPYENGWIKHGEGDNVFYAESLGNGFYYYEAHY